MKIEKIKNMSKTKNPIKLRTVFMGTSSFAGEVLKILVREKYNIISVYTQPDKKVGRNQSLKPSPVKVFAEKNNLKIREIKKFDESSIKKLKHQKPDLVLVVAYGKILPQEVLDIPGFGSLNIHASLLPKYRGPSPVHNAILNGETETGATLIAMDNGIDSGDIIAQEKIFIEPDEILPEVMRKMLEASEKLILEKIPLWIERKIKPQKQDESKASFCQLIERADGKIFWNEEAEKIYNKFRAFQPWPGVFSFWENGSLVRIKLNKISLASEDDTKSPEHCGEIIQKEEKVVVKAGKGYIILEEVQSEGKKSLPIQDFINGHPKFIGSILK